jgi:hypothetical protein
MRVLSWVRRRVDWRSDAGFAAGGEMVPFGVLVFVIGTLMVTNLWGVIDLKMATDAAAREGARFVAESDGPGPSPADLGRPSAEASLAAHGRDIRRLDYGVAYDSGRWAPCARVTVTATYPLALINLPMIGLVTGDAVEVSSTHTEIIDPYRSRAADAGEAAC